MNKAQIKQKGKSKTTSNNISQIVKIVIAIFFWIFIVTKLFIYDIDSFIIKEYFPNTQWVINYKFFILIGLIMTLWLFTKKYKIIEWFLFIVFYPFILFFWQIPVLIFKSKSWNIGISVVNTIISLFSSFKYIFFIFTCSMITFCILFNFNNPTLIHSLILILLLLLILIYFHRFSTIFMPSSMYKMHHLFVNFLIKNTDKIISIDDEINNLSVAEMNTAQLQKWTSNLQFSIILNRSCYFLSSKLYEYQKSNLNIIFYILNLFVLLIITVFFFAGINSALFRIHPDSFTVMHSPNFFSFIYYSFSTIFFNTIPEIIASSGEAHLIRMIEIIFSFFLISIFTVLLFNINSKKHSDELGKIIRELNKQGDQMESRINLTYKLSIENAITELERLKGGLIKIIYFLSENLGKRE